MIISETTIKAELKTAKAQIRMANKGLCEVVFKDWALITAGLGGYPVLTVNYTVVHNGRCVEHTHNVVLTRRA